jgi:hypothetical protein
MTEELIITGLFYLFFFLFGALVLGFLIHRLSATQVPVLSCFISGAIFLLPINLLVLHYLLWLWPHHPSRFYTGMLIIFNACLYLTVVKKMKHFFLLVFTEIRLRLGSSLTMILPVVFILLVYTGIFLSASKPFVEHDAMEYAVYGNSINGNGVYGQSRNAEGGRFLSDNDYAIYSIGSNSFGLFSESINSNISFSFERINSLFKYCWVKASCTTVP